MLSEEDITINRNSFNPLFKGIGSAIIGVSDMNDLNRFFGRSDCFSSLLFAKYVSPHKASYDSFIKRPFIIQTAISNANTMVNSNRTNYLIACMKVFGQESVANYGSLFKNQYFAQNKWIGPLPPNAYFGFAMENSIAYHWITEKLFFMYSNDMIPIYRGHIKNKEVLEKFGVNLEAFIDASNMSIEQLTSYLQSLVNDKKKMYEIYRKPLIKDRYKFDQMLIQGYTQCFDFLNQKENQTI